MWNTDTSKDTWRSSHRVFKPASRLRVLSGFRISAFSPCGTRPRELDVEARAVRARSSPGQSRAGDEALDPCRGEARGQVEIVGDVGLLRFECHAGRGRFVSLDPVDEGADRDLVVPREPE